MRAPLLLLALVLSVTLATAATGAPIALAKGAPVAPEKTVWGRLIAANGVGIELSKPSIVVGSSPAADAVLADRTVSPQHARLTYADGRAFLEDLGSKYGTLVAGSAVKKGDKPRPIAQKTDLAFGAVSYTFEFGVRPALIPPLQALPTSKGKTKAATPKTAPAKDTKPK